MSPLPPGTATVSCSWAIVALHDGLSVCTALRCTAIHYTALHCTAMHLHWSRTTLHALHYSAIHLIVLYHTTLYFRTLVSHPTSPKEFLGAVG